MKSLLEVLLKKGFANKGHVEYVSSSLDTSFPFHSLVNMVDSEDITLEKNETQEMHLEINTSPILFNKMLL